MEQVRRKPARRPPRAANDRTARATACRTAVGIIWCGASRCHLPRWYGRMVRNPNGLVATNTLRSGSCCVTLLQDPATVTKGPHTTFIPTPPPTTFEAPDVWVDRDQTKGWIRRLLPVLRRTGGCCRLDVRVGRDAGTAALDPAGGAGGTTRRDPVRNDPLGPYVWRWCCSASASSSSGTCSASACSEPSVEIECPCAPCSSGTSASQSFSFYDRVQSGQLISRANSDIRSVQMFLAFAPMHAVSASQLRRPRSS